MRLRQKVLVLYLKNSALDAPVLGWAQYDGTGQTLHMAGDLDAPPYATGVEALMDGACSRRRSSCLMPAARSWIWRI
jgi:hypothetical protein